MQHRPLHHRCASVLLSVVALLIVRASPAHADDAAAFFDPAGVREIRITFTDPNWFTVLQSSHATNPADPYFPCRFEADGIVIDPCGVRMKGNSSFSGPGIKKPFKLDLNQYEVAGQDLQFHGLTKLSLNNNFKDPSALRERIFHEFVSNWVPTIRTVSCRLYINNQYWGLYTAAEAVNKDFVQRAFGSDEDGNVYKAEHVIGSTAPSDLTWLGNDPSLYYLLYELQTNEAANDYTGLLEFINVLNNTPAAQLPAQLPPLADVDAILRALALNNLFVNLDSYTGSEHNYYVYERTDTGQFTHIFWDANEAFGNFRSGIPAGQDPRTIPALFVPTSGTAINPHPLMEKLWAVPAWQRAYLRHLATFLREGFNGAAISARAHQLADIIRTDLYADPNDSYTTAQFETNLDSDVVTGNTTIYGLKAFTDARAAYLNTHLNTFASRDDLQLNELMALNVGSMTDEAGDHDPWVEIYNLGPGLVTMSELFLTDSTATPGKWQIPNGTIDDGVFRTYWPDGETAEGASHANFALNPAGGSLYLYKRASGVYTQLGAVSYPPATADVSWCRSTETSAAWGASDVPTPGAANVAATSPLAGVLFINELMATNTNTIADEFGGFADWFEVYNASDSTIDLTGVHFTDSLSLPTQWTVPAGTTIPPHGHRIIWCDNEPTQGPLHATFKLAATGETVAAFAPGGATLIDAIVFPALADNVAYGRPQDGGSVVELLPSATPGASNSPAPCAGDFNGDSVRDGADLGTLLAAFGVSTAGDMNSDGVTDGADLGAFLAVFGQACP